MTEINRSIPPVAYSIEDFPLTKPTKYTLDNGLEVFAMNAYSQPVLTVQLIFKGGKLLEEHQGAAFFASRMLMEGTTSLNSAQMSDKLETLGASVFSQVTYDIFTIDAHCLSRFLPEVTETLIDILQHANFPQHEFTHIQNVALQNKKVSNEKNNVLASRAFKQKIYGKDHPFSYDLDEEKIAGFDLALAKDFYNKNIKGQSFTIFLSGAVNEEDIKILNQSLGQLSLTSSTKDIVYPEFVSDIDAYTEYQEKEQAVQTSIKIGRPTFKLHHPDRTAFAVTNEILGGFFGSRLMKNIREDKGLTYGIYSGRYNSRGQGYFMISSDVQKAKRAEALEEIYKEVNKLVDEKVSEEELSLVKNYMAGTFMMSINSYISLTDYMKQLYLNEFEWDYYDTYISRVNNVTAEDVQNMAKKYFTQNMVEISVG